MSFDFRPPSEDDDAYDRESGLAGSRRINRAQRGGAPDMRSLGVRVLLSLLLIGLLASFIMLVWQPLGSRSPSPTPTVLAAEGAPVVLPTFTPGPPPTPLATATTVAAAPGESEVTPAPAAQGEIAVGVTAVVANTENQGVNMRREASTSAEIVQLLAEGTALSVVAGPTEADGFTWWQVKLADGDLTGWVAAPFLQVAP